MTQQDDAEVRASDGDRDLVVTQLQRHFTDGRLTRDELGERVGTALAARTIGQLRALTTDLPALGLAGTGLAGREAAGTGVAAASRPAAAARPAVPVPDLGPWGLILLLCLCPPAGIAYWLVARSGARGGWLAGRQLAGIPNWVWILIIIVAATAAARR